MTDPNTITIGGRMARDVELRFIASGKAVANIRIGHTPRRFDRDRNEWVDGDTTWIDASIWGKDAEHAAEMLHKGDLVLVTGSLKSRTYEKDGDTRTAYEIAADSIALIRAKSNAPAAAAASHGYAPSAAGGDPWASAPEPQGPAW